MYWKRAALYNLQYLVLLSFNLLPVWNVEILFNEFNLFYTLITNEVKMTVFHIYGSFFVCLLLCQMSANVLCPFLKLSCLFILEV